MSLPEQPGQFYDIDTSVHRGDMLRMGLLTVANIVSVYVAYELAEQGSVYTLPAVLIAGLIHGTQVVKTVVDAGRDFGRDYEALLPEGEGGQLSRGAGIAWFTRNLLMNTLPLMPSLAIGVGLHSAGVPPTPIPTPPPFA